MCFLTWSVADNNICVPGLGVRDNPPEKGGEVDSLIGLSFFVSSQLSLLYVGMIEVQNQRDTNPKLAKHKLGL